MNFKVGDRVYNFNPIRYKDNSKQWRSKKYPHNVGTILKIENNTLPNQNNQTHIIWVKYDDYEYVSQPEDCTTIGLLNTKIREDKLNELLR